MSGKVDSLVALVCVLHFKLHYLFLGFIEEMLDHLHLLGKELHLYKLLRVFNLLLLLKKCERLLPHALSFYCFFIINHQTVLALLFYIHPL